MSSCVRRGTHLSRLLAALRRQRGLKPGQLAARLGAANVSRVGSLIRGFELGEPLGDFWLQKLIEALQPDPAELQRCLELDRKEEEARLERDRLAWEAWADQPIEPSLTIRYMAVVYGERPVPRAFCHSRELAEAWAADECRRFGGQGVLSWSRRERTAYDRNGLHPRRYTVGFGRREAGSR